MSETSSFENDLLELEDVLRALESDSTSLDDALAKYERGVALLRQCYARLKDAEQKIVQLTGLNADGSPVLEPFEHKAAVARKK